MTAALRRIALDAITLDPELQPRAEINRAVLENYVQLLVDDVMFPPVVVFREGRDLWLADGFHRWHANKVVENEFIAATVREGTRRDALLWSLSANASHGLQRASGDYTRAYEIAVRNAFVDPTDSDAVAALLRCSGRTAERLTEKAREAARAARDAEIIRLKDQGKTHREVARELDVSIGKISAVQKQHSAETEQAASPAHGANKPHSAESSHPPPFLTETAKANLRELASPEAKAWSSALAALRLINEQVSVDELYELRFVGFDHAIAVELVKAAEWINELRGRFVNERHQRRRASRRVPLWGPGARE